MSLGYIGLDDLLFLTIAIFNAALALFCVVYWLVVMRKTGKRRDTGYKALVRLHVGSAMLAFALYASIVVHDIMTPTDLTFSRPDLLLIRICVTALLLTSAYQAVREMHMRKEDFNAARNSKHN